MEEQRRNSSGEAVGAQRKPRSAKLEKSAVAVVVWLGLNLTYVYVPVCLCLMCINFDLSSLVG